MHFENNRNMSSYMILYLNTVFLKKAVDVVKDRSGKVYSLL